jgi:hypothetical protein
MAHTLPLDDNDVVLAESKVKRNHTEVNADFYGCGLAS